MIVSAQKTETNTDEGGTPWTVISIKCHVWQIASLHWLNTTLSLPIINDSCAHISVMDFWGQYLKVDMCSHPHTVNKQGKHDFDVIMDRRICPRTQPEMTDVMFLQHGHKDRGFPPEPKTDVMSIWHGHQDRVKNWGGLPRITFELRKGFTHMIIMTMVSPWTQNKGEIPLAFAKPMTNETYGKLEQWVRTNAASEKHRNERLPYVGFWMKCHQLSMTPLQTVPGKVGDEHLTQKQILTTWKHMLMLASLLGREGVDIPDATSSHMTAANALHWTRSQVRVRWHTYDRTPLTRQPQPLPPVNYLKDAGKFERWGRKQIEETQAPCQRTLFVPLKLT